ncbi:MAG: cell division protein FtsZ, partial [Eggerthellaceae bacterium]|nr:cell division protein FtsZ [Eggerthellaceae bacterium]
IATGFKMNASQSTMDFTPIKKDLFASTEAAPAPSQPAPVTFSTSSSNGRFADEDYIPDFLKRQR